MTRCHSLMLAKVLMVTSLSCQQPPSDAGSAPRDTTADREAISQVREREIAGFSAGATDSVAALLTTDVVVMPPNEPAVTGRDSARAWLKRVADQFTVNGRYTNADIAVAGDWAIERFEGELTLTPKAGGRPVAERVKGIHIYRRQSDGTWRIAQDVWNSNAAPPAPAARSGR